MQESELVELITKIKERKTETSKIEFKSSRGGVPEKLYDTFSSFSNTVLSKSLIFLPPFLFFVKKLD